MTTNPSYCGNYPDLDHTGCPSSVECTACTATSPAAPEFDEAALQAGMKEGESLLPTGSYRFLNHTTTDAYRAAKARRDSAETAADYWHAVGVMVGLGGKQ